MKFEPGDIVQFIASKQHLFGHNRYVFLDFKIDDLEGYEKLTLFDLNTCRTQVIRKSLGIELFYRMFELVITAVH